MDRVSSRAYAKINIGLDVTGRRSDGYHLVDMIMQTMELADDLSLTVLPDAADRDTLLLKTDRPELSAGPDNLVCRAAAAMRQAYGIHAGLRAELTKRIPMAAGMAGGSADAAATFRAMRDLFVPEVQDGELEKLALPLGADIPYCITGGTQRAQGIGEVLTKLPAMEPVFIVIAKPPVDVPTGRVYRELDSLPDVVHPDIPAMVRALEGGGLEQLMALSGNVLEAVTGGNYPVIGQLERLMEGCGAIRAMMTGSGPAVFGVFREKGRAEEACGKLRAGDVCKGCEVFLTRVKNNGDVYK
ncbi:MAG: 4-(cytidine 5'-diphospho)-2-C-methyl-D-erythritol kinase [Lachnospiraceae bacterium]|jgi:4-diphosphocytidyl-2-C-methyl-D-erythritol kinase|nr:4-(cytidine 5'-diphospho)-2-C-methyl-D-erythritol kinase [Lachnospiraceae bacterium]